MGGCAQPGLQCGTREAILFSEIGNRFFQDSVSLVCPDGAGLQTLLAPQAQPLRSFEFAHGTSLKGGLVVLVHQLLPDQTTEDRLFFFNPATGALQQLALPDREQGFANLTPDGGRMAFELVPRLQPAEIQIWADDLSTGQLTQLTAAAGAQDRYPSWRPGDQEIIFLRLAFTAQGLESRLMRVDAAGGNPSVLFSREEGIASAAYARDCDCFAMWSAKGLEIVNRADLSRRLVMSSSSFLNFVVVGGSLAWSQTQNLIAFSLFNTKAQQYELWTIRGDGSDARSIHASKDGRIIVSGFVQP